MNETAANPLPRASAPVVPTPTTNPATATVSDSETSTGADTLTDKEMLAQIQILDDEILTLKDHRDAISLEGETSFMRLKQMQADSAEAKATSLLTGDRTEELRIQKDYDELFERDRTRQNDLRGLAQVIDTRQQKRATLKSKYRQSYRARATTLADEATPQIEAEIIDLAAELSVLLKEKVGASVVDTKGIVAKLFMRPGFKRKLEEHAQRIKEQIGAPL